MIVKLLNLVDEFIFFFLNRYIKTLKTNEYKKKNHR